MTPSPQAPRASAKRLATCGVCHHQTVGREPCGGHRRGLSEFDRIRCLASGCLVSRFHAIYGAVSIDHMSPPVPVQRRRPNPNRGGTAANAPSPAQQLLSLLPPGVKAADGATPAHVTLALRLPPGRIFHGWTSRLLLGFRQAVDRARDDVDLGRGIARPVADIDREQCLGLSVAGTGLTPARA